MSPRVVLGIVLLAAVPAGAACRSAANAVPATSSVSAPARTVQPGAPGEASRVVAPQPAIGVKHTAADTAFMQGMIGHHAQAVEMVELLKTRTTNPDMHRMGLRIEVSQNDEITMMQTWLRDRGESIPDAHAHHM